MFRLILIGLAFGFGLLLSTAPVSAQNNRSFVSGKGFDTNSCALTTPCRTFQRAHDMTNAGGEIAVLDTAGYGIVTITKSISIIAPDGIEAGITVAGSNQTGITINNQFNDSVTLRGLTISGAGGTQLGIFVQSGGKLIVKNCVVTGFSQSSGIDIEAAAPAGSGITDIITDTVISNNSTGIFFEPKGGGGSLSFERLQFLANDTGILIDGAAATLVKAAGSDSIAAGNAFGFQADRGANFMLDNVKAVNNGTGIIISGNAAITLSRSVLYGNTVNGYEIDAPSFIKTLGDNRILQSNNVGTLTSGSSSIQ
jgi:hypothetical protein